MIGRRRSQDDLRIPLRLRLYAAMNVLRRRRRLLTAAGATAAALVVAGAVLIIGGGEEPSTSAAGKPDRVLRTPALADPIPYDGRSPRLPATGDDERVIVALPRPALGERSDLEEMDGPARVAYVRSLERESRALRSALGARGVRLREVVTFERAWHGFAATVRARDLARLASLGVSTRPVRRFFPATSEPVPLEGPKSRFTIVKDMPRPVVALLAGGVARRDERVRPGYDAVNRDADASPGRDPRDDSRFETSGEALAAVLLEGDVEVLPLRISAFRAAPGTADVEEYATTDSLLAGLERAVDPDLDGDPADRALVALVGVGAPYAGFAGSPEAEAVAGATKLGTLVIAPGGHEGPGRGAGGTVASPAAAPAALAVAARSDPQAVPRAAMRVGEVQVAAAALLGGSPPAGDARTGTVAQGRVAVLRAGTDPVAQAAAASAAGATLVILAEPRPRRPLPAMPAGRLRAPVVGVTGAAAEAVLRAKDGTEVRVGAAAVPAIEIVTFGGGATTQVPRVGVPFGNARLSPFTSRGPSIDGRPKPDLALPATAVVAPTGRLTLVAGAGVAAAGAAIDAAKAVAPSALALRRRLLPGDRPDRALAGSRARPARVPVGALRLEAKGGRTTGVRFTVGAFDRGDPAGGRGTLVTAAERLELTLESAAGAVVRRLTPPGGERGLLPGEFAYTLSSAVLDDLAPATYRFRVRARAPRQTRPTVRASKAFRVS